ncbi:MAG: rRNA maturation RNase YbeY [Proteobacteria bacterium]|nr:rRNA maturation RNase YbeY [Pseudomonadota bacterium]MBU1398661.1 rRNA maturation RNase YbeY [Pseudomonadota bacterium]
MGVLINNTQKRCRISQAGIRETAQVILNALDCPDGELSILIVDDNEIAKLNKQYLQREGPTNVIAFPMRDGNFPGSSQDILGDVVISVETAEREGNDSGAGMRKRFAELLIHGILHLFGYDHERNRYQANKMEKKAVELMKKVNSE